ncbi:putative subunit Rpb4 of RNA polymerase [Hamiltosporidium tvaerminnensis]|uniref:Putative subunit Rpb4 of RNA polymerase n=3 Tax=Hamiltosporidium TaxID=1176354 RepID=A0A4Q9LRY3_9MICR|nr:hypothetical protein LUQ84_002002 [Hamiltosporidium tvaerminnensis]TBT99133.1 putative subunit Rpb4 of RNA polymerase [Hamiltosporidium tvaerminnensis]TBU03383.1 putative subunit Rpb4 of RNA polymerase [Hamiltosporidium magnivora]TBU10441.1 putative subunit Rpb4 of RNA polymerase [Hamiltosporidium tvaerminnensis]
MKIIKSVVKFLTRSDVYIFLNQSVPTKDQTTETLRYNVLEYCSDTLPKDRIEYIVEQLKNKNLMEIEIYMLIDQPPKSLLDLQLIIEEMEERYSEEELHQILMLFRMDL